MENIRGTLSTKNTHSLLHVKLLDIYGLLTYGIALSKLGYHYNDSKIVLQNHSPEVFGTFRFGTLRSNIFLAPSIALVIISINSSISFSSAIFYLHR